jgi:hypothetical protein
MRIIVLFLLVSLLISCSQLAKKEESKPEYEMKSFHAESESCKTDSIACATFDFTYPVFPKLDSNVQKVLADQLNLIVNNREQTKVTSIEEQGNAFIHDFAEMKNDVPDLGLGWYFKSDADVLIAADTLISVQVNVDMFTGGAHGMYNTHFINIDPKTGALYLIDSFLKPGYADYLTELGEEEFRKEQELSDTSSLEEAGFGFSEGKFQLNENYGFRKEGIVFFYNSYEVAAYATGPTEIIIPYEKLRGWFK